MSKAEIIEKIIRDSGLIKIAADEMDLFDKEQMEGKRRFYKPGSRFVVFDNKNIPRQLEYGPISDKDFEIPDMGIPEERLTPEQKAERDLALKILYEKMNDVLNKKKKIYHVEDKLEKDIEYLISLIENKFPKRSEIDEIISPLKDENLVDLIGSFEKGGAKSSEILNWLKGDFGVSEDDMKKLKKAFKNDEKWYDTIINLMRSEEKSKIEELLRQKGIGERNIETVSNVLKKDFAKLNRFIDVNKKGGNDNETIVNILMGKELGNFKSDLVRSIREMSKLTGNKKLIVAILKNPQKYKGLLFDKGQEEKTRGDIEQGANEYEEKVRDSLNVIGDDLKKTTGREEQEIKNMLDTIAGFNVEISPSKTPIKNFEEGLKKIGKEIYNDEEYFFRNKELMNNFKKYIQHSNHLSELNKELASVFGDLEDQLEGKVTELKTGPRRKKTYRHGVNVQRIIHPLQKLMNIYRERGSGIEFVGKGGKIEKEKFFNQLRPKVEDLKRILNELAKARGMETSALQHEMDIIEKQVKVPHAEIPGREDKPETKVTLYKSMVGKMLREANNIGSKFPYWVFGYKNESEKKGLGFWINWDSLRRHLYQGGTKREVYYIPVEDSNKLVEGVEIPNFCKSVFFGDPTGVAGPATFYQIYDGKEKSVAKIKWALSREKIQEKK